MATSFKEALEALVNERIAQGEDPKDLFEELAREANLVFGHYNLEYEFGLLTREPEAAYRASPIPQGAQRQQ